MTPSTPCSPAPSGTGLAYLFIVELKFVRPERAILALSGQPRGDRAIAHLTALKALGIRVSEGGKTALLHQFKAVAELPEARSDLILVSISSHGFQGKDRLPYIVPTDGDHAELDATCLSLPTLLERLRRSKSGQHLLLLDVSQNAPLKKEHMPAPRLRPLLRGASGRGDGQEGNPLAAEVLRDLATQTTEVAQAILASCGDGQHSCEDPEFQQGAFTHFLLQALRGQAEADAQRQVRLDQVVTFTTSAVEGWSRTNREAPQRPWLAGGITLGRLPMGLDPRTADKRRLNTLLKMVGEGELRRAQYDEASRLFKEAWTEAERKRAALYRQLADGKIDLQTALRGIEGISDTPAGRPLRPGQFPRGSLKAQLGLSREQEEKVRELLKEFYSMLEKMLTPEQRERLKNLRWKFGLRGGLDHLGLSSEQRKKVADLEKDLDTKLNKILTNEQKATLREIRERVAPR